MSETLQQRVIWAACPILRAADECDMPQIMHGPHPVCRHCAPHETRGGTAGCRIVAGLVADAALAVIREHLQSDAALERAAKAIFALSAMQWDDLADAQPHVKNEARAALAAALGDGD